MTNPRSLFDLTGKTALITGGSRGLGIQLSQALGDFGARIVISSRKETDLVEARDHLKGRGIDVEYVIADVANDEDAFRLADEAIEKLGKVDILVNNAGASWGAPAEDHPIETFDKIMNLNIRSLFVLSQRIAKKSMIPNNHGRVISMSSMAGMRGSPDLIGHNTSKGAVINFTRSLAAAWGKYGITVNALAPGMFPSKMTKGTFEKFGVDRFANAAPLGRIGDDQNLKGALLLFASDAGKHIPDRRLRSTAA